MVTANVFNRFKYKTTMNDSYVEKYIRAKRRNEVTPKCLFGAPSESESEQFLSEQSGSEQTDENQRVLEKYDLTDVPTEVLAEFRRTKPDAPEENATPSTSSDTTERVKFQPRIITEGNPPPRENLFSPIDKIESTSPNRTKQAKITDYWQTSKRRRSSSRSETESQSSDHDQVEASSSSSSFSKDGDKIADDHGEGTAGK